MAAAFNVSGSMPEERVGWELIWRRGSDHPRYGTCAAPDAAVTEWAATLPPGGFVLDLGCGVGGTWSIWAVAGFAWPDSIFRPAAFD